MNALDFTKRFEEDGLRLFEMLASDATQSELRTTFNVLAAAQRQHLADLAKRGGATGVNVALGNIPPFGGFSMLMQSPDIHREMRNDPDGFWHIVHAEEEFIGMLEGMSLRADDPAARNVIRDLVTAEKMHLEMIENIYDFVKTPHTYLEWGEFSNLHPL